MLLILASKSTARKTMLEAAGVSFAIHTANVDEDSLKAALLNQGLKPRDIADALAEAKALRVSTRFGDALVLGSDQILETENGDLLSKPDTKSAAIAQLGRLSGTRHRLWSAAVLAQGGRPVWRHIDKVDLHMRPLTPALIDNYVDKHWKTIQYTVGCYEIESEGVQLFSRIDGSHFTILGLPLLAVLSQLRVLGVIDA